MTTLMNKIACTFTITRTTRRGILEYLTKDGFRNEELIRSEDKLYFTREEGSRKVRELRDNCRLPELRKTIILNY